MNIDEIIARKISDELKLDVSQYEIIRYGAFAFIQIMVSIIAVALIGFLFGVMLEALIVSFSTSILRQYSGGIHAGKPVTCFVIGTTVSIGLAVIIKYISNFIILPHFYVILPLVFIVSFFIIYRKAPVDSEAKPIKTEIKRNKMKKNSLLVVFAYLLLNITFLLLLIYLPNTRFMVYSLDIYAGMLFQVFSLTIIGHKIIAKIDNVVTSIIYWR